MIYQIADKNRKEEIARSILYKLPEWFGIPESTDEYINCCRDMPFWADIENDRAIGFICLKETSYCTAEIYVIGVLKEFHRHKIGQKLFNACYEYAKNKHYLYMQVKTLKEGCDSEYDKTNRFYRKIGFNEFECFPTLWDVGNPCQIYIMSVK